MVNRRNRRLFHRKEEKLDLGVGLKAFDKALSKKPEKKVLYKMKLLDVIRATAMETCADMNKSGDTVKQEILTPEAMNEGLDSSIKGICKSAGITDEELLAVFREAVEKAKGK